MKNGIQLRPTPNLGQSGPSKSSFAQPRYQYSRPYTLAKSPRGSFKAIQANQLMESRTTEDGTIRIREDALRFFPKPVPAASAFDLFLRDNLITYVTDGTPGDEAMQEAKADWDGLAGKLRSRFIDMERADAYRFKNELLEYESTGYFTDQFGIHSSCYHLPAQDQVASEPQASKESQTSPVPISAKDSQTSPAQSPPKESQASQTSQIDSKAKAIQGSSSASQIPSEDECDPQSLPPKPLPSLVTSLTKKLQPLAEKQKKEDEAKLAVKKKVTGSTDGEPLQPKRPVCSFLYFLKENAARVAKENNCAASGVTPILSKQWKEISPEEKAVYEQKAKEDVVRFKNQTQEMKEYGYFTLQDGTRSCDVIRPKKKKASSIIRRPASEDLPSIVPKKRAKPQKKKPSQRGQQAPKKDVKKLVSKMLPASQKPVPIDDDSSSDSSDSSSSSSSDEEPVMKRQRLR